MQDKYEVEWQNAEILNKPNGRPYIVFHNVNFLERIKDIDISISHSKENAVVYVVVEYE